MPETIDVTGLPEAVVRDLRQLVTTLRFFLGSTPRTGPPPNETPEEWFARLKAWAESHPRQATVADDSRDSIYDREGE
jgi:hypothetical protein